MREFFIVLVCLLFVGCGLLKSDRMALPPAEPRLDAKQDERIRELALVNHDMAKWIRANGVKPNEERAVLLEDGTYAILKLVGRPYEELNTGDIKDNKKVIERGLDVATDFQKANAKYDDKLYNTREKLIKQANSKWDFGKIIAFFTSTAFLVVVGLLIASIFFPVLLPVIQIMWQLFKAGFGAFKIMASLGVHGIVNVVKSIESFRDANKGTEVQKAFDSHMKDSLTEKDKAAVDALKNHFNI